MAVIVVERGLMVAVVRAAEAGGFEAVAQPSEPYGVTVARPPKTEGETGVQGEAPQRASP